MNKIADLSEFDFSLPKELIAQKPAQPRDSAKLLVYDRQSKEITDDVFYNLDKYLVKNTTLVLNDAKVDKARIKIDGCEIFVINVHNPTTVEAMVFPGRKFKHNTTIQLSNSQSVAVKAIDDEGVRTLSLSCSIDDPVWDGYRQTPFPPYIEQDENLAEEYQTIYALNEGSKAAPTAGLHFTHEQLIDLAKSHAITKLTLNVGLGTFAPLKEKNIKEKKLHKETFSISSTTANTLNGADHLTAVGTTTLRALESVERPFAADDYSTDIFIQPGYEFKNVNSLITNFHLPKSSLIMLVAAFAGTDEVKKIYMHAIENRYRFYSFGDAMLII